MPLGIMVTTIAFVVRVAGTSGKTNAILFVWHYAGEEHPFPATTQSKFNPLQQVAYVGVMYGLLPLLLLTGLLCLYPQAVGDVFPRRKILVIAGAFCSGIYKPLFIFGHLYLCTTGRTPHETFKSMVDGYHRH